MFLMKCAVWSRAQNVEMLQQGDVISQCFPALKYIVFSIPQLVPEEVCRDVPKELCQIVFLNPKTVKVYCLFVLFKFKAFLGC